MTVKLDTIWRAMSRRFRKRRMEAFVTEFVLGPDTRILDVGGTPFNWSFVECPSPVTLLNLKTVDTGESLPEGMCFLEGDARCLEFDDGHFAVIFSNSVIEHVGDFEDQVRFASEIRRAGRNLWIQTPARCFFFEPHLVTPFVHYLPYWLKKRLLRNFTVWGWLLRPSRERVEEFLATVRLLNLREMKELFPDCEIRRERFLGMTKSYVAVRHQGPEKHVVTPGRRAEASPHSYGKNPTPSRTSPGR